MTADHMAYQRATQVSLIGLSIQVTLLLVMLLYSILGQDTAAMSAAYVMILGLPIWLALALVFNQHRRERLEVIENEGYRASSLAEASVFEEDARGHNVHRERLEWMHRWMLPAVSVLVALGYLVLGIWQINQHSGYSIADGFVAPPAGGWAMGVGAMLAAGSFVFARYVAGMAKQAEWSMLHAGAGAAVAAALVSAAIAIGHFADIALNTQLLLRYLPIAIDILIIALGVEVILNFVLSAYRPRKRGEVIRPAFDSRAMAYIAAPDRLAQSISDAVNYQFGFNVSSTWFYKLLARSVALLLVLGLAVAWLLSTVTIIQPDERALVLNNGRPVTGDENLPRVYGAGPVLHWPWPFSTVIRFPADGLNTIDVGTVRPPDNQGNRTILWTTEPTPDAQPKFFMVRASARTADTPAQGTQADEDQIKFALITAEVPIHYKVGDLSRYVMLAQDAPPLINVEGRLEQDPERFRRLILISEAERIVTQVLAQYATDAVLGRERNAISAEIHRAIQARYDEIDSGVTLLFAGLVGTAPQHEVAAAFEELVQAGFRRQTAIEDAQRDVINRLAGAAGSVEVARLIADEILKKDRLEREGAPDTEIRAQQDRVRELIEQAGGNAAIRLAEAQADRWSRLLGERARVTRNAGQLAGYQQAPQAFLADRAVEAIRQLTLNTRVWISPFEDTQMVIDQLETQVDIGGLTEPEFEAQE